MPSEMHQNTCSLAKKKGYGGGADAFAQGSLLLNTGLSQAKKMHLAVGFESLI